jgi:hypothetical protein
LDAKGEGDVVLSRDEAIERMRRPINKPVSFTYPGSDGPKAGVLKDRAVVWSGEYPEGTYWDVVDLIEFPGEPPCIRIGYYRQVGDEVRWGSQTTITESLEVWKRILTEAGREKEWVRALVLDVAKELQETP